MKNFELWLQILFIKLYIMNKNILFYSNCQTDALMHTINFTTKKLIINK